MKEKVFYLDELTNKVMLVGYISDTTEMKKTLQSHNEFFLEDL